MRFVRAAFLVSFAVIAGAAAPGVTAAADLGRPPVIGDESMIPEDIGTGWYLRGDVGYSFNKVDSFG
ncbi:hypothetical protein J8J40_32370, partial [Mycobacterium tuberculosis]|nr:hypothetical protein [Mycobacterium tuberculosis]